MKLFLRLVIFPPAHMARLCVVAGGLNFILSQRKFASKMNTGDLLLWSASVMSPIAWKTWIFGKNNVNPFTFSPPKRRKWNTLISCRRVIWKNNSFYLQKSKWNIMLTMMFETSVVFTVLWKQNLLCTWEQERCDTHWNKLELVQQPSL